MARRVLYCGRAFWTYRCLDCDHLNKVPISCNQRLEPRCATRRAHRFIARHANALDRLAQPKLLTLTWISPPTLTPELLSTYNQHFAHLRRQKLWTNAVKGGMAGYEFTWTTAGWHPHIHALIDSDYIPQPALSRAWMKVTDASYIVDIRAARTENAVFEVAKYVAKGSSFYTDSVLLDQFLATTKGRRFFTTFGSFYRADPAEKSQHNRPWALMVSQMIRAPPRGVPFVEKCEECDSPSLWYDGYLEDEGIEKPTIQIPF